MATLIELRNAEKRYGDQLLLEDASVALPEGRKIGLVGRNGSGKSTLCRILLGDEDLDRGEVTRSPRLRIGYLRQHDPFEPGESVIDFLMRDSAQAQWQCGEVANQFGLKGDTLEQPVAELSGGWQTRVKLSALLLHDPNLLVLDEPTNFLDLRTQMLLERFLREFRAGCLIVSHDRTFLKATCNYTLELARGSLNLFPGDVDAYLSQKDQVRDHDERVNAATLVKRKQLETFINKNRANAGTASQARNKQKQLDRLKLREIASAEKQVRIRVPASTTRQGTAMRCLDMSIGYPDLTVATDVNLEVEHGTRTAVVGENGHGKTTLLRSIIDSLPPLAGQVEWGYGCETGVYAQHVYGSLPERETIFDYLNYQRSSDTTEQTLLDVAGSFLFHGELVNKPIKVLSGGERARVCLAALLLAPHNVLVLDEPGNHLDVETLEALAEALIEYPGTLIFTSHDRHFVHRVATGVIEVRNGRVRHYPDDYDSYVYRIGKELEPEPVVAAQPSAASGDQRTGSDNRKAQNQRRRQRNKEITSLERTISRLDDERSEIRNQLMQCTDVVEAQRLHEKSVEIQEQIKPAEQRWLELSEEAEADTQ
jgi:ATP-binding cassette subfamily F protein 3